MPTVETRRRPPHFARFLCLQGRKLAQNAKISYLRLTTSPINPLVGVCFLAAPSPPPPASRPLESLYQTAAAPNHRYIFSEEYLKKVGRNLALGIYTAVANPVSLEGRHLLCSSALLHEDLSAEVGALGVPVVLLQSTEDVLVNPANVDPFLRGRSNTHHFWSHEFRDDSGGGGGGGGCIGSDGEASSATAVSTTSVYGLKGLTDLLKALSKPRGTFVAWVRAGHEVCQESKRAVIDLLDVLAKPTPQHTGVDEAKVLQGNAEGAVTLGLFPSGEWVARVNKRGGEKILGTENSGAATHEESPQEVDTDGSEGNAAAMLLDNGRLENKASLERDSDNSNHGLETGVFKTVASPFPTDISIPTLPANITYRQRAPNTSPVKRRNPATSSAATTSPGGSRQARSVDAFGFVGAKDSERNGGERVRRRGRVRDGGTLDSQSRGSDAVGDPLVVEHGTGPRPKVVWKDTVPSENIGHERTESINPTLLPKKALDEEDEEERARERRGGDYSSSYFPTAALLYDDGSFPSPTGGAGPGVRVTRPTLLFGEASANKPAILNGEEDPWDLVKNSPSLEFETAGQLQRGNRRWVVNKTRDPNDQHGDAGGNEISPTSPLSSSMTTAATKATTNSTPSGSDALGDLLEAEASLESRLCEARRREAGRLVREEADAERRIAGITEDQRARSRAFVEEDRKMIAELEAQLASGRLARAPTDLQRAVDGVDVDDAILREGLIPRQSGSSTHRHRDDAAACSGGGGVAGGDVVEASTSPSPIRPMPPLEYSPLDDLPEELRRATDAYSVMDDAARDEKEMLRIRKETSGGTMSLEQFQRDQAAAASEAAAWRLTTKKAFRKRSDSELERARVEAVLRFQPLVRGVLGRKRACRLRLDIELKQKLSRAATRIQAVVRVLIAKKRARIMREAVIAELVLGGSAVRLQSVMRGVTGRRRAAQRRREVEARTIQRCYRGHLGRRSAAHQRALLEYLKRKNQSAVKVQAWWRGKLSKDRYTLARASSIAAVEIQRIYRGVIGRRKASRRLKWAQSEPGPERLKLGVRMIEDSKVRATIYLVLLSMYDHCDIFLVIVLVVVVLLLVAVVGNGADAGCRFGLPLRHWLHFVPIGLAINTGHI